MHRSLTFTPRAAVLIVILLCLAGGWFRLWNLGGASLWIDEGFTINAANAILKHGYPLLDSGYRVGNGYLSTYSVAGMLTLVPLDPFSPWAARLPAAVAGIAVIAATYALARGLFGGYFIGLVSAGLVALMKWEIAWSQQSRGYTMLTLLLLLAALFLWRFLQERRWRDLAVAAAACTGAWLSHELAVSFLPAFGFVFLAYLAAGKLPRMRAAYMLLLAGALGIVTWFGLTAMTHLSPALPVGYLRRYADFLLSKGPKVLTFSAAFGVILGCFDRRRSWPVAVLAALTLLPALIIMGYSNQMQFRYLFPLIPFFTITGVYAAVRVAELTLPFIPQWASHAAAGAAFTLLCLPLLTFIPLSSIALESGSPQPAFNAVFTFLKPLIRPGDIVLSAYPHLNRIYLGDDGMWLAMPLAGNWQEIKKWVAKDMDRYTGAPAVVQTRELTELLDSGHGYVIVDTMTRKRRPDVEESLLHHPNASLAFEIRTSRNETTRVYQFRQPPR